MRWVALTSLFCIVAMLNTQARADQLAGPVASLSDDHSSISWAGVSIAEVQPGAAAKKAPEAAKPKAGQAPAPKPAPQPAPTDLAQADRSLLGLQQRWLASAPNMFGDLFANNERVGLGYGSPGYPFHPETFADIPAVGGGRVKVADNNRAMPDDRVFFVYNHFHNALFQQTGLGRTGQTEDFSVDRYVFGIEKTFCSGCWSLEFRLPLFGQSHFTTYDPSLGEIDASVGHWGNVALILKNLLWQSETTAVAAGLAIDIPTGSNVETRLFDSSIAIENEALHLGPYLGMTSAPTERLFFHAFAQVDFAANGNSVHYANESLGDSGYAGQYTDQNLLFLDGSAGYWLYRDPSARRLTGLAGVVELHYATTLQDSDHVGGSLANGQLIELSSQFNRVDVLNLTAGLHGELGPCTTLRVAAVAPLRGEDFAGVGAADRFFDSEIQVSLNRRF